MQMVSASMRYQALLTGLGFNKDVVPWLALVVLVLMVVSALTYICLPVSDTQRHYLTSSPLMGFIFISVWTHSHLEEDPAHILDCIHRPPRSVRPLLPRRNYTELLAIRDNVRLYRFIATLWRLGPRHRMYVSSYIERGCKLTS